MSRDVLSGDNDFVFAIGHRSRVITPASWERLIRWNADVTTEAVAYRCRGVLVAQSGCTFAPLQVFRYEPTLALDLG